MHAGLEKDGKKAEKVARWEKIMEERRDPPVFKKWGSDDENNLQELKKMDIKFEDTAIGRLQNIKKRELHAIVGKMSKEEREEIRRKLNEADACDSST